MRIGRLVAGCAFALVLASAGWALPWPSAEQAVGLLGGLSAEVPGVELVGEVATYDAASLQQYLGDDAQRYFAYDYQWTVASLVRDTKSSTRISVDLYRFSTDLDAFGAFSMGRDPLVPGQVILLPGQSLTVSAYWSGNQLHVWRGPLYLRLVPTSAKTDLNPLTLQLAQAVAGKLPAVQQDPPIFKVPPARDLIPESVKFQRRNVLGRKTLGNALLASYGRRQPGKLLLTFELVLFDGRDAAGAQTVFGELRTLLTADVEAREVPALAETAFALRHPTYGQVTVLRQGRFVGMARQIKDPQAAEAAMRELAKNASR